MPSIGAAHRARRVDERRRRLVGLASVAVGTLLVGVGAAGAVGNAAAPKTGALVGGLAAVGALVVLLARVPVREREAKVAAGGISVGLGSLLCFWLLAPAGVLGRPVAGTAAAALAYCVGLAVVLASYLAAATSPARRPGRASSTQTVAWTRSRSRDEARDPAADGGGPPARRGAERDAVDPTGDELAFPLDED